MAPRPRNSRRTAEELPERGPGEFQLEKVLSS